MVVNVATNLIHAPSHFPAVSCILLKAVKLRGKMAGSF